MKYMLTYDFMETIRNTNQWLGASVHALGSYPAMSLFPNPAAEWMKAWGEVTERTFARMVVKPDWNLPTFTGPNGNDRTARAEVGRSPARSAIFCISRLRAVGKRRAVFCWWHRCPVTMQHCCARL